MSIHKIATVFSIILALATTRCHTQSVPPISGTLALSEGWKPVLYLVQPRQFAEIASSYSGAVVDSASISADGRFAFSALPLTDAPTLFQLCIQKKGGRYPHQLMDEDPLSANYMPIALQKGEQIDITADAERFQATFSVKKPSAVQAVLLQLRTLRHRAYTQGGALLATADHTEESTLLEHEAALQRFRAPLMAFADSSASLWAALVAARWVSPTGDYERVPEFLFHLCEKWRQKMPTDPWVAQLCKTGNKDRLPILVGDQIPNFPFPMADGDTVLLHSLLGKRLTLLDIWASWCLPCRRENRERLLPLWETYREKGLAIIGYSIDSSPAAWRAAIAKDGAAWPHASHLSGDATPFLDALRIRTIPANLLLDAQGGIVAKNLHGDALKAFVDNYFDKK